MEGQTHFGMPRGAKMHLALIETKWVPLHSNTTSKDAPQVEKKLMMSYGNNQWKIIRDQLPTKCPIDLKG